MPPALLPTAAPPNRRIFDHVVHLVFVPLGLISLPGVGSINVLRTAQHMQTNPTFGLGPGIVSL